MDDAGIGVLILGGLALFGLILFGAFMFALEQRQKVVDVLHFKEGSVALLIGGKHVGTLGTIEKYKPVRNPKENLVDFKEGFSTVRSNVFVVGKETSEVTLP